MKPQSSTPINRAVSLEQNLLCLKPFLSADENTEIVVNKPGEVLTLSQGVWSTHSVPELTLNKCMDIARLTATFSKQTISYKTPILSATLPNGERIQVVMPPACLDGTVSFTIRRPSIKRYTLDDYEAKGMFDKTEVQNTGLPAVDNDLLKLNENRQFSEFLKLAVKSKKNIIISGSTGSGKTTFCQTLLDIVPQDERLISIENVDELKLYESHPNTVNLFYSANKQGVSETTQQELLESSLRMKPDRVFVAELIRGDEAFYYLRNINSGHPGSMTTIHANSTSLAFEQLVLFLKESQSGATLSRTDIKQFLYMCVDIVVQVSSIRGVHRVTEIYYDPIKKHEQFD